MSDQPNNAMERHEWIKYGYDRGFCGPDVCEVHDGIPMSEEEATEFDEGGDPCLYIVRLYNDAEHKAAIEEHDSPSVWRALNAGLK